MKKSRTHQCREDHVQFITLWQDGIPMAEIAYRLSLSKAQMANHLTKVVDAELARPKSSYEVVLADELPRAVTKLFPAAPLFKIETVGDGLILTPYSPKKVKKITDDQMAEDASEICDDLASSDPTADSQA